jgi:uncharacterized protein (TIGR03437 family)
LLPDGATYVLPAGAAKGVASRPARPGETIAFFGIGFGPVTPPVAAGRIAAATNSLTSSLSVLFRETEGAVTYAGLAPGTVGLYQFNVTVPAVPASDWVPVVFRLGGVVAAQTVYTAVGQ